MRRLYRLAFLLCGFLGSVALADFLVVHFGAAAAIVCLALLGARDRRARRYLLARVIP